MQAQFKNALAAQTGNRLRGEVAVVTGIGNGISQARELLFGAHVVPSS